MWRIYCKARTKKGIEFSFTPYLWSSESEALQDIPLCAWYKSIRKPGEPNVPPRINGRVWFLDVVPDESWDRIRLTLSGRQVVPLTSKRKRRSVPLDSYQKAKRVRCDIEEVVPAQITNAEEAILRPV